MVWTIFAPDTLMQSATRLASSSPFSSQFNYYSASLSQSHEYKFSLDLEKYQLYVEIATDVLQTQNHDQLKALKNFLNTLPSPTDIETVLTTAVNQLAEIDRETYDWILKHPDYLLPELDLVSVAQNLVESILTQQGLISDKDFEFTSEGTLKTSPAAEMALFMNCSEIEYVFIQEQLTEKI
ncbi:MAG: hypothetical protein WBA77_11935 [Microcoleaceae cyanobacterium]